jgi:DNA-binding transcriptional LysR family regulator
LKIDQLSGYLAFHAVARCRSFTAAGRELDVSASAVSQAVTQLERRLGARLFDRTTRSVALTEAGAAFLERVGPALDQLAGASDDVQDRADRPSGTLRLTVPRIASRLLLAPLLPRFLAAHPELRVDVTVDDTLHDIVADGFDAGIRLGETVGKDMVAVRLGSPQETAIVCSPKYLRKHGTPKTPADLRRHACINHRLATSGTIYRWELVVGGKDVDVAVEGPLTVNDTDLAVAAALAGVGIACTFASYVERELATGRLVRVLERHSPPFPGFHLYHSSRKLVPGKLRAFIDFCRRELP